MQVGQRSIGSNGKENVLYPMETLRVTQDSFGKFSHFGSWAVDTNRLAGVKENIIAPFTGTIRIVGSPTYAQFAIVSNDVVNHADGTTSLCAMLLVHSDNMPTAGAVFQQGAVMCQTGNSGNSAGIHLHFEVNKTGAYTQYQNSEGVWCLSGQVDPALSMYMNDTDILVSGAHDWKIYEGGVTPPQPQENDVEGIYLLMRGFL